MPRVAAIALTVAVVAFALPANAQQNIDFSKVEIKTIDLGHNTYRRVGQVHANDGPRSASVLPLCWLVR